MNKKLISALFLLTLFVFACSPDQPDGYSERSLLEYGLPVTLLMPDSAKVKTMDLGLMKDISVKYGDDYFVQITASEATGMQVEDLLAEQLNAEKGRRNFSRLVMEDANGFIVERTIDSTRTTYDFRKVLIKGGQEIIFQTGLSGFYTLEEVNAMYESVLDQQQ